MDQFAQVDARMPLDAPGSCLGLAAGQALPTFPAVIHISQIPSRLAVAAAFSISALGQADDVKLTGKPYIDMNYGPYLSASIEAAPGNIAYKLLQQSDDTDVVGPIVLGMRKPVALLSP